MNPVKYSFDHNPHLLTKNETRQMIDSCTSQFEQMKIENAELFQPSPNIREMDPQVVFSIIYDIGMNEKDIFVVPVNEYPCLGTSGVASCFAVTARGETSNKEILIGLAHVESSSAKQILEGMTKSFRQKGCLEKSIEFYIIGGILPNEEPEGDTDSPFINEKEFIALKDEYNIKSVYFNHVKDSETSLSVVITKDGAQWTTREDALVILSDSSDSEEGEGILDKRKRNDDFDDEYPVEKKIRK